jgi:protein-S-isoprenylcysteine O-methyltransferase Ste14
MVLAHQTLFGTAILFLLAMLVVVKGLASGSIFDKLQGSLMVRLVNVFNLFFLLVVNPLAAIALIARRLPAIDPTQVAISGPMAPVVESAGLVLYTAGFLLMAWAFITLGANYQLGGCDPRAGDRLVEAGPYRLIRNPMYAAALAISLGLALLLRSLAFFAVFAVYLALILPLITIEEAGLQAKYGGAYAAYRRRSKKLVPFLY